MSTLLHSFHIPVMGIGHSIDTPLRMAPLGISSVISLVDDLLLEKLREYYCSHYCLPYHPLPRQEHDGRARRIQAYLDMVHNIVEKKMAAIRQLPFFQNNDKQRYFELLPESSILKQAYRHLNSMTEGSHLEKAQQELSSRMMPGSIDVNIMVKLDRVQYDQTGKPLGDQFTDAKSALRGYANSVLESNIVFSAGLNPRLFSYLSTFADFFRDAQGRIKKKIIVKVSDFRSALIQSRFLAKHGLEVSEYRVESGLNCGGHAFPSQGQTLPVILSEFRDRWDELTQGPLAMVKAQYQKMKKYFKADNASVPRLSVQGGIGTAGEVERLMTEFGVERTGWGSPFLLVPEVTNVDDTSRELLRKATTDDLYLSDVSPLGVPFNNLRATGSERWTLSRIDAGRPGSACPSGFAVSNTEFTARPICVASRQYQKLKLKQIECQPLSDDEKSRLKNEVMRKTCICVHLGNGVLIKLGLAQEAHAPQAVCPGPNIAWFNRIYSLEEMVDHIYGRIPSLVPSHRPHMFATELKMNVDYFESLLIRCSSDPHQQKSLLEFRSNLEKGVRLCMQLSERPAFGQENLLSLKQEALRQQKRLMSLVERYDDVFKVEMSTL